LGKGGENLDPPLLLPQGGGCQGVVVGLE
jgi:hypothetical protein